MIPEASHWELAALATKLVSYLAMASVIAAAGLIWLSRNLTLSPRFFRLLTLQQAGGAALGLSAALLFLLLQSGEINQAGPRGMFDREMLSILASTAIGDGMQLKALGFLTFLMVAAATHMLRRNHRITHPGKWEFSILPVTLAAAGLLGASFAVLGHAVTLPFLARIAIALHTVAIALWVGSLIPLLLASNSEPEESLAPLLRRFGQAAWFVIAVLLVTGLYLVLQLTGSLNELVSTPYGLTLLLKLMLVTALLALGALNRFRLVPALERTGERSGLRRSIMLECVAALAILIVTAWLTTMVGPVM